ncbi:MmcQ/YjbR family DNA-binding protein [Granulicella sp. L46]|uniref:MmcQ/YjbR family DNA-binding protein n=1 Tax=Granulicella sp. L46 TaxID=1641865 RepID=UPI00131BFB9A|nr:MmcQ/YjbR family DNA-binding protein [Granulicella sp. L46]
MKIRAGAESEEVLHDVSAYRRLALAMPGAVESSHMGAPDFRINGKIFATLAYGQKGLGTLKLSVEQQAMFLAEAPEYFSAAPGGWGRRGTLVRADAPESVLAGALSTAFHTVLAEQAVKKSVGKKRVAAGKKA